jgi:hypothetical protein
MNLNPVVRRRSSRLRVIFNNDAVSRPISSGATFGEIADIVQHVVQIHESGALAIDVTMPMSPAIPTNPKGASHGTH